MQDKNTSSGLCAQNAWGGGAYARGFRICRTHVESYTLSKLCCEQAMMHTGKTNAFTAKLKAVTVTAIRH